MARKKTDKPRLYDVIQHERGLGFVGIEFYKISKTERKITWRGNNHCAVELCEHEIKKRKQNLLDLAKCTPLKKFNYGYQDVAEV